MASFYSLEEYMLSRWENWIAQENAPPVKVAQCCQLPNLSVLLAPLPYIIRLRPIWERSRRPCHAQCVPLSASVHMTCSSVHTACLTSDYSWKNCWLDRAYWNAATRVVCRSSRECSTSQPRRSRFWLLFPATFLCSCISFALPSQYTYCLHLSTICLTESRPPYFVYHSANISLFSCACLPPHPPVAFSVYCSLTYPLVPLTTIFNNSNIFLCIKA